VNSPPKKVLISLLVKKLI